jgi:hypothetical protein
MERSAVEDLANSNLKPRSDVYLNVMNRLGESHCLKDTVDGLFASDPEGRDFPQPEKLSVADPGADVVEKSSEA